MNTRFFLSLLTSVILVSAILVLALYLTMRRESPSMIVSTPVLEEREEEEMEQEPQMDVTDEDGQAEFQSFERIEQTDVSGTVVSQYTARIVNPTTGDEQAVWLILPEREENVPLVVLIAGGTGDGESFVRKGPAGQVSSAELLAAEGVAVVAYAALGTGETEGKQDFQGHADQDGLATIVRAAKQLSGVDSSRVGLASFSYGVTAATGVLARYPELGIRFLSDWEGPSSRWYTTVGCNGAVTDESSPGHFACADDEHWLEREAAVFLARVEGLEYYWRIQQTRDHVQSTYGHTVEMLEAAQDAGIPWFRVNEGDVGSVYTEETLPTVTNGNQFRLYAAPHIVEMIRLLN